MAEGIAVAIPDRWYVARDGEDVTEQFTAGPPGSQPHSGQAPAAIATDRKKVMVVYGHDREANEALFDWLRAVGLEPREWGEPPRRLRPAGRG